MTITAMMILATTQRDKVVLRPAHTAVSYCCPLSVRKWRRDDATINLQDDKEDNVGRTNKEEQEEGNQSKRRRHKQ